MQKFISLLIILVTVKSPLTAQTLGRETISIETSYGIIKIKLYEETPLHKANFLRLIQTRFFDSLLFHRVINNFMIQGGDPLSKKAQAGDSLGHGDLGYTIPAEIKTNLIHKKGALCAARESDDINPDYASSASQFYIVMGKKRNLEDLKRYEDRINKSHRDKCAGKFIRSERGQTMKQKYNRLKSELKTDSATTLNLEIDALINAEHLKKPLYTFDKNQTEVYTTIGGTPHLDGTYTVFGQVIDGLEVIDKIASSKTDLRDRPIKDIRMKIKLLP
jgi:cyclophilin family peptidyl-prolyl cis-trans isomerase